MSEPERPLVIVPTYNERENLPSLAAAIFAVGPFHILVVDDNSPDGTGVLADELASQYTGRLFVLHRAAKEGLGKAYLAGFRWGLTQDYTVFFEMDADFSHDPAHLPQFLEQIRAGADVVLGSRHVSGGGTRNWSILRTAISRGGSFYARRVLRLPLHDLTSGFKCFRRSTLEQLDLDQVSANGYGFQIEVTYRCARQGLRIVETPIIFVDRRVGHSKMSWAIVGEAMWLVSRLRWQERRVRHPLTPVRALTESLAPEGVEPGV